MSSLRTLLLPAATLALTLALGSAPPAHAGIDEGYLSANGYVGITGGACDFTAGEWDWDPVEVPLTDGTATHGVSRTSTMANMTDPTDTLALDASSQITATVPVIAASRAAITGRASAAATATPARPDTACRAAILADAGYVALVETPNPMWVTLSLSVTSSGTGRASVILETNDGLGSEWAVHAAKGSASAGGYCPRGPGLSGWL